MKLIEDSAVPSSLGSAYILGNGNGLTSKFRLRQPKPRTTKRLLCTSIEVRTLVHNWLSRTDVHAYMRLIETNEFLRREWNISKTAFFGHRHYKFTHLCDSLYRPYRLVYVLYNDTYSACSLYSLYRLVHTLQQYTHSAGLISLI